MVPYWSLIRADSALKERAESPVEGASYARIVASAQKFFYSILRILNLLKYRKYYRYRNFCRYFVKKITDFFSDRYFQQRVKVTEGEKNVELSSRRPDCESSYWLMEDIKLSFLLTQLSVCLSVCLHRQQIPLCFVSGIVLYFQRFHSRVARPQDSMKVKVQFWTFSS